jgi:hypothetical protein
MMWNRSNVICASGEWPRTPAMNAADMTELVRAILVAG